MGDEELRERLRISYHDGVWDGAIVTAIAFVFALALLAWWCQHG